jgi:hypothetical protein
MTGLPDFNYPAFHAAAAALRDAGFVVENPAENPPGADWRGYMRLSLIQLAAADGLAVLDGWQLSRGAVLEVHIAHALQMPVHPVDRWLAAQVVAA